MGRTLTIDRRGIRLERQDDCLVLRHEQEILAHVPLHGLKRIVLSADTQISSGLLAHLASRGIGLIAFGGRHREHVAELFGAPHGDARIRVHQALLARDFERAQPIAAAIVKLKVRAQRRLLAFALERRHDQRKALLDGCATLDRILITLRTPPADRDTLLGLEGAASAAYFAAFGKLFPPSLGFTCRRRRPPPDPVNACLSLGYTLLIHTAARACQIAGLDPAIGFLHALEHGRPALACDLAEPQRARIDRLVWELFRERRLEEAHFHRRGEACELGKAGRSHFYEAVLPRLEGIERHLLRQARLLARSFREEASP